MLCTFVSTESLSNIWNINTNHHPLSPHLLPAPQCFSNVMEDLLAIPLVLHQLNAAPGSSDHFLKSTSTHSCVVKGLQFPGYSALEICWIAALYTFVSGSPREKGLEVSSVVTSEAIPADGLGQQDDLVILLDFCH